jgi:hypothetical protein
MICTGGDVPAKAVVTVRLDPRQQRWLQVLCDVAANCIERDDVPADIRALALDAEALIAEDASG